MNRTTIVGILLVAAALLSGEVPAGLPKGAVEIGAGKYRYTDKDRKVWIYRKTPFGMQRTLAAEPDEQSAPAGAESSESTARRSPFGAAAQPSASSVRAVEDGDSVRFERPTPFGRSGWTKKKSELTAEERRIWESQQASGTKQASEAKQADNK